MNDARSEAKAAARAQLRGVWAAITTAFTPDLEIDGAGLRRNRPHVREALHVDGTRDAGKPHVRLDERGGGTECPTAAARLLDSTHSFI